jgi:transcriptional regulator with XRE-family HTH domain
MSAGRSFGEFFKQRRIVLRKTLRQFCQENRLDPGNISKLERGLLPPPQDRSKLEEYAKCLRIKEGSDDYYTFFDLARISAGQIPEDVLADSVVADKLPILFRTLRGQKVSEEKLKELVEIIKRA